MKTKTPRNNPPAPTALAAANGSAFPDIGIDPLKISDMELENALARLRKACAIQQLGVPDQTALVWRIDISRLLGELTLMTARWKHHPSNPQNAPAQARRANDV